MVTPPVYKVSKFLRCINPCTRECGHALSRQIKHSECSLHGCSSRRLHLTPSQVPLPPRINRLNLESTPSYRGPATQGNEPLDSEEQTDLSQDAIVGEGGLTINEGYLGYTTVYLYAEKMK
jgi:hypothetical protein